MTANWKSSELRLSVLLLVLCVLGLLQIAEARYLPNDEWKDDHLLVPSGVPVNRRNNFCQRQFDVDSGRIQLKDALKGLNVSIGVLEEYRVDGTFGPCEEGSSTFPVGCLWIGAIIEELSKRAGFNYNNSFAFSDWVDAPTFGSWMLWAAKSYDVSLAHASQTTGRLESGLVWTANIVDNSFVLATRKAVGNSELLRTFFQFLEPFTPAVWGLLFIICLVTSIGFVAAEYEANDDDLPAESFLGKFGEAVLLAAFQFTGAGGFTPKTHSGHAIVWIWSFTVLLIVSAYTANLATFLISKKNAKFELSSIAEAEAAGSDICVVQGFAVDTFIKQNYPGINRVFIENTAEASWNALKNGDCIAEALALSNYETRKPTATYDPLCEVDLTPGLAFHTVNGGFFSESDNGVLCTGLLKDVFHFYISQMKDDGWLQTQWKSYGFELGRADPKNCTIIAQEEASETTPLDILSMGGIFLMHSVITVLAAIGGFFIHLYRGISFARADHKREFERTSSGDSLRGDSFRDSNRIESTAALVIKDSADTVTKVPAYNQSKKPHLTHADDEDLLREISRARSSGSTHERHKGHVADCNRCVKLEDKVDNLTKMVQALLEQHSSSHERSASVERGVPHYPRGFLNGGGKSHESVRLRSMSPGMNGDSSKNVMPSKEGAFWPDRVKFSELGGGGVLGFLSPTPQHAQNSTEDTPEPGFAPPMSPQNGHFSGKSKMSAEVLAKYQEITPGGIPVLRGEGEDEDEGREVMT